MEALLYEKLSENEARLKKYGVHVAGAANLGANLAIYPLFLLSTQLQLSPRKPVVKITGSSFSESLASFLFTHHPANKPYRPAQFYGYKPAVIANFLLGGTAFYRGCFTGSLHFYGSLLIQSYTSRLISTYIPEDFWTDLRVKIAAEIGLATLAETLVHPLFVAQSRFALQSPTRCHRVYHDFPDMLKKSGLRELYTGWGGVLPKQTVLVAWQYAQPFVDVKLDEYLGVKKKMDVKVMARETLLALFGFLCAYPLMTIQRRTAVQSTELGMRAFVSRSCTYTAWRMLREEGPTSFFRGIGVYSLAIGIWVVAMPTLTQYVWMRAEETARSEMKRIIDE